MKLSVLVLVILLSPLTANAAAVDPITKVVQMLGELRQKIVHDGEEQEKAFEEYVAMCKDGTKEKEYEIKTAKASIEDFDATISKSASDALAAAEKIDNLAAAITTNSADLEAAAKIREQEASEFAAAQKELVDTIDTIERATNVLQRELKGSTLLQAKVDRRDVANLIHTLGQVVEAVSLSLPDRQHLMALAQQSSEDANGDEDDAEELGAPAPEAYTAHSASIIDVLEDLRQKAVVQLNELRKEEVSGKHNFEMMKQSLEDQVKFDTTSLTGAKSAKAEAEQTKASTTKDLSVTKGSLVKAEDSLKGMKTGCVKVAADHAEAVKSRKSEIEAITEAIKVIQERTSGAVAVTYSASAAVFFQTNATGSHGSRLINREDLVNFEVLNMVRKLAREQKSAALAQLAGGIATVMKGREDPFAKVKAMISAMVERLEKEAGEEATHKAYCDKEYSETEQKTGELKYDIEKLSSKLDKARAESASLKAEASELQASIAATIKAQAEADKLRKEEYATYVQIKSDLEQGLEGVRMGLKVLNEYYAAEATAAGASFVQKVRQPSPITAHEKASGAGTTVIGMLEVVESDLSKHLASVEMQEVTDSTEYERISMDNRMSKAMDEKDVKYKTKQAASLDKSATDLASDLDATQTELAAVLEYTKNIRGMCELKPESYEDREARRTGEINGLKAALKALEGEALQLWEQHRRVSFRSRSGHKALRGGTD